MGEPDIRALVAAVVEALAEKGLWKGGSCGCPGAAGQPPGCGCGNYKPNVPAGTAQALPGVPKKVEVTMGTAGKVFTGDWNYDRAMAASDTAARESRAAVSEEQDHTAAPGCPHCDPMAKLSAAQFRELGADRIAVCHPTKGCSPIARYVDHTLLKPNAVQEEVARLCGEAKDYCFASVCVNPIYVPLAAKLLAGAGVRVCTVVGFPLGSTTATVKAIEARDAIANGADEIDMVLNIGALKSGNDETVYEDLRAVREATRGRVLKVILETALLTREEKVRACLLAKKAGADFVKTSTGFGGGGATVEDIRLMRGAVGPLMGVKASGGIRDTATAQAMIRAGATRLGTSASIAIVSPAAGNAKEGKY